MDRCFVSLKAERELQLVQHNTDTAELVNIECMATRSQRSYTLFEGRGKTSRSPISITQEGM